MRVSILAGWLLLLAGTSADAGEGPVVGYARSLDTGKLLYVETHVVSHDAAGAERRLVVYQCAAGAAPFARKELVFGAERDAPTFTMVDARSGFLEGLAHDAGGWRVFVRGPRDVATRSAALASPPFVADAGFDRFVRGNWARLVGGDALEIAFVVPSRLDTMPFKVRKLRDDRIGGEAASVFRLSLAGPLGWFLPDIDVSYRDRDQKLLRYRGLTNIRDASGATLEAEIDFPEVPAGTAPPDFELLRTAALTSRCQ